MTKLTELYIEKFAIQLSGSDIANNHKGFVLESEKRIMLTALFPPCGEVFQSYVQPADGRNSAKIDTEKR